MWILFAFGSAFFAGITSVLAKCGLKNTDSHVATAIRTAVVLLFAWLLALLTGGIHTLSAVTGRSLLFLLLSGLATGGSWLCYFRALQLGDVNKVTPVDKTSTVLTMLLAALFLGETLSPLKWVCLFLILLGTWAMISRRDPDIPASHAGGRWFPYALGSAFLASITSLLGKVGMEGIDSNLGTAIRTVVVLLMAWGIVLATGKGREIRNIDNRISLPFPVARKGQRDPEYRQPELGLFAAFGAGYRYLLALLFPCPAGRPRQCGGPH